MRFQIISPDGSSVDSVNDIGYPEAADQQTLNVQILIYSVMAMEQIIEGMNDPDPDTVSAYTKLTNAKEHGLDQPAAFKLCRDWWLKAGLDISYNPEP